MEYFKKYSTKAKNVKQNKDIKCVFSSSGTDNKVIICLF